ncbi:hypothetical protein [Colwellia sp. BRX9-1]|uniref:hypothetical protein n=1 Tax=Colwellia sp. BRX9-1 TaxID=2759830 RepID=UPI0015F38E6B|nr:hypothetical protein [Colwellia sp. BRX9-1]MBA6353303.1 hypothetical protein [Colwellia sp. BRX9-1]
MNLLKALILLAAGAILGYGFSSLSTESYQDNLAHPTVMAVKTPPTAKISKFKVAPDLLDQTVVATQVQPQVTNNQTLTTVDDEEMLNQQHLDLIAEHQLLKDKYKKSKRKVSSLKYQLSEFDGSEATDEEMEKLAPEPFKFFLSSFRGKTRNDIYDFHQKEDDLDWGYNMQNNISDFVLTHYDGMNVDLISVICKQPYCEILVTEKQEDAWDNIIKDLSVQTWWKFSSFSTSTKSNEDNELSIYAFFTQ